MIIYRANLAEKLFGYALSREFIKFDTTLCDLLDNPDLELDFELAINFNKAINGNLKARETFTNTFILCSGYIDPATINFYTRKMNNYPIFKDEIKRINYIFANIDRLPTVSEGNETGEFDNFSVNESSPSNVDFYKKLKDALKDCLNAPCNVFSEVSPSIGKIAQVIPSANSTSLLSLEPLKDSMVSITNGMDMLVFNDLPKAFQDGISEVSKACSDSWGYVQNVFVEETDLPDFVSKAASGQSLRSEINNYRYTPDLKSYFDISTVASNVLGEIASTLGGCFSRYEHAVRYNGYDPEQNLSQVNKSPTIGSVNGVPTAFNSVGQSDRVAPQTNENLGLNVIIPPTVPYTDQVFVSEPVIARSTFRGNDFKYTIFAGWKDDNNKTVWTDSYAATAADVDTRRGIANIGMVLTPSIPGSRDQVLIDEYLNGGGGTSGYTRATENNLNLTQFKLNAFNQGMAISEATLTNAGLKMTLATFARLARRNQIFAAVSHNGKPYELIQLIDRKGTLNGGTKIIDFTPYAFYKITNALPIGGKTLKFVPDGWKEVTVRGVPDVGEMSIRFCVGTKEQVTAALAAAGAPTSATADTPAAATPAGTSAETAANNNAKLDTKEIDETINRAKESYEKGSAKLATLPPGSTEAVELQQKLTKIDGLVARAEVLKGETIVHNMRVTLDNKEVFAPGSENERRGKEILSTTEANLESLKAKVRTNYGENSFNEIITS
jgi:hypothetical protein